MFISYARKDFDRIALTLDQIQQIGHDVWWDVDIEPGADWKEVLSARIARSRGVILFVTEMAAKSDFIRWEISEAKRTVKSILAVKLDDVDPASEVGALFGRDCLSSLKG